MELEKLKEYLQNYLDSVAIPRFNKEPNENGIESFQVHDIVKGSYEPIIFHIFLDSIPVVKHPFMSTKAKLRDLEKDIHDFMKMFTAVKRVRVHLNKRPVLKPNKEYDKEF